MKVKIINCKDELLWYNKHIGETFDVVKVSSWAYWCRERNEYKASNFIHKSDAEVVSESE